MNQIHLMLTQYRVSICKDRCVVDVVWLYLVKFCVCYHISCVRSNMVIWRKIRKLLTICVLGRVRQTCNGNTVHQVRPSHSSQRAQGFIQANLTTESASRLIFKAVSSLLASVWMDSLCSSSSWHWASGRRTLLLVFPFVFLSPL